MLNTRNLEPRGEAARVTRISLPAVAGICLGGMLFLVPGRGGASAQEPVNGKSIRLSVQQGMVYETRAYPNGTTANVPWRPSQYDWVLTTWADSSKLYANARNEIDRYMKAGNPPLALVEKYQKWMGVDAPAINRFRYAYAVAYAAGLRKWSDAEARTHQQNAAAFLALPPTPPAYEYARLRFFLESRVFKDSRLLPLGKRLLAQDPDDHNIKERYASLLIVSNSDADRRTAIRLLEELIARKPNTARYYSMLGMAYDYSFSASHQPEDGQKAIEAYKKYLAIAPINNGFRPQAERYLKSIEKKLQSNAQGRPAASSGGSKK